MSIVDPAAPKTAPAPKPGPLAGAPKAAPRPSGGANGANQGLQLKRKASGSIEVNQIKVQRKDGASQPAQTNGAARPMATPGAARPNPPASINTVPYRGTAAPAGAKVASPVVRKPNPTTSTPAAVPKAAAAAPKPTQPAATSSASAAPKKGYLALLQKAKEKDASKPAAPPVQNGPTKILTKKERLALKAEAKGKKPITGALGRPTDAKGATLPEKKKSVEVGYQGTARPTKPPVQVGYRGTARPASAPASTSRNGTPAAKSKSKPTKARHDGYADWSDLDDDDLEGEDDYESDASSDMEGGIWDVEQEEQLALKAAKQEDAEALAEEQRLKREKEARKKKLLEMSKQAAARRKY
ncbi:hypothetical protein FB567DRAFT_53090 [Paraphoma chrysanthemicola]|uniref:SPT2 chromatin protein n=1 Tax=Paraphoma chrysanthemicola TaxID=798071 RepID=A0A8K0VYI4_9PLEO|nr:hypothetical protein FB567DRAFT_53090 [Paraphoma chrysanthemicola]